MTKLRSTAIAGALVLTIGSIPVLNACGGISDAAGALACLEAGASTVQVYSALIFEGPGVVGNITRGLAAALGEGSREAATAAA